MEEASRTHAADARVPSNQGKKYKAGRADLSEDIKTLKTKNGELTEALKYYKNHLNQKDSVPVIIDYYYKGCLLYTSPSPRDRTRSRMPSSA